VTAHPRKREIRPKRAAGARAEPAGSAKASRSPRTIWAYAYQIVPPQTKRRLSAVTALLDREHAAAREVSRTFSGRLVLGENMTRILLVSDSLERCHEVNQKLDAELKKLRVEFSLTAPVALP
jgi:hypothetical protein